MLSTIMHWLGFDTIHETGAKGITVTIQSEQVLDLDNSIFKLSIPQLGLNFELVQCKHYLTVLDNSIDIEPIKYELGNVLNQWQWLGITRKHLIGQGLPIPTSLCLPKEYKLVAPLDFTNSYKRYQKRG